MSGEGPNQYQKDFFKASLGRYPETDAENVFAASICPVSLEDAAWRHATVSASCAKEVVSALQEGDHEEANRLLQNFRDRGMQTRGFSKEALTKLLGLGIIPDLYEGGITPQTEDSLREARESLEELESTPRPDFII